MYVRLAFAVAAHLESEILIVDEVLAVGDAEFQKKCLGKMGEVSKGQGRTVLFVSHNLSAVSSLCKKGFFLKNGEAVLGINNIEKCISSYQKGGPSSCIWEGEIFSSNGLLKLYKALIKTESNDMVFTNDADLTIEFYYQVIKKENRHLRILFNIETQDNVVCFSSGMFIPCVNEGFFVAESVIPKNILNKRIYNITARVDYPAESIYIEQQHFLSFELHVLKNHSYGIVFENEPNGLIHLPLKYQIRDYIF